MKPIGPNFLLRPDAAADRVGALYIPDAAACAPNRGTVVAVGPDVVAVEAGNVLIFRKYAGAEVVVDGVPHLFLTEDDVLLVEGPA